MNIKDTYKYIRNNCQIKSKWWQKNPYTPLFQIIQIPKLIGISMCFTKILKLKKWVIEIEEPGRNDTRHYEFNNESEACEEFLRLLKIGRDIK